MADKLLTPRELADELGVAASTVRGYLRTGQIEPAKRTPGGHARYMLADVRRALSARASAERETEGEVVVEIRDESLGDREMLALEDIVLDARALTRADFDAGALDLDDGEWVPDLTAGTVTVATVSSTWST